MSQLFYLLNVEFTIFNETNYQKILKYAKAGIDNFNFIENLTSNLIYVTRDLLKDTFFMLCAGGSLKITGKAYIFFEYNQGGQ